MKKLNDDFIKGNLFINAEEVYGTELIDELRKLIYDISWSIVSDEYLVNNSSEGEDLDLEWGKKKSLTCLNVKLLFLLFCYMLLLQLYWIVFCNLVCMIFCKVNCINSRLLLFFYKW